ncbi:MAG TPA: aquaporin [Ktedonobacterales bacterium]
MSAPSQEAQPSVPGLGNYHTDPLNPAMEPRRLFAEAFGTCLLTLVAAGADTISAATGTDIPKPAGVIAPALMVMAMIYAIGDVSGAHFNPVVTLAFAVRDDFPWKRVPGYWIAQFVGAIVAAAILRILFGDVGHLGANLPTHHVSLLVALVTEALLTAILVTIILGTAHDTRIVGHNAAIAVGATIALAGLIGGPVSGASMNPARSLGPALVGGTFDNQWIYLVGPVLGSLLACAIAFLLHGPTTEEAKKAAGGL